MQPTNNGFLPQGPPPAGYPTQTQQAWGQPEPGKQQWGGYPPQQQQQPGAYPPPQPQAYGGYGAPPPQQAYGQAPPPPPPVERTPSHSMLTVNVDPDTATSMQFADTIVRNGFVRKVFGIVGVQLLITVGVACACLFVPSIKLYVRRNQWTYWLGWGLALALLLVLACVEKARRSFPANMILLGAFTVVQAYLVGVISAYHNIEAVMLAFLVTSVAVVCISLFAINTKIDVTRWGTLLLVALVAFIVLLIVGLFWINKVLYLVIAGFACLLFSAYLLYDIQLVMGGRYYSISPDEYIFAALNIYLDIVNLFMWMLTLIGLASSNN